MEGVHILDSESDTDHDHEAGNTKDEDEDDEVIITKVIRKGKMTFSLRILSTKVL